jgi:hypothetical protein
VTKLARQGFAIIEGPLAPGGSAAMAAQVREKLTAFMEGEAVRIYEDALDTWPIRTGKSRAGLFIRDDSAGSLLFWRIGNTVEYARYIKSVKLGKKIGPSFRPVMTRDLGDPVRLARKTLPARAADLAAEALEAAG